MITNFKEENIPECKELKNFVEAILNKIITIQPVDILGNLVDKKTKKYCGYEYFKNTEKNTAIGNTKSNNDFSGLYIFYSNDKVEYVGISNSVIRRLKSHLVFNNNSQSGLVYLIAKKMYEKENKSKYFGQIYDFPFEKYKNRIIRNIIKKWKIKVVKIESGYYLSYSEIYIASALKSYWNCF